MTQPAAELQRILHNMDDHTQVMHDLFAKGGLPASLRRNLLDHIRHEEAENLRRLEAIKAEGAGPAYELDTLIQHSRLLAEIAQDEDADGALVAGILHHFAEEHEWIAQTLGAEHAGPHAGGMTVGSLLGARQG